MPTEAYSPIKHLAYSLFLNHDPKQRFMAMLTIYLDASGNLNDRPATVVAGFIASVEQWLKFEKQWKAVLSKYGVSAFHAKAFAHFKKDFETWRDDEPKRRAFLADLFKIIQTRTRRGFSAGILTADYNYINAKYQFEEFWGPPYSFCGLACINEVDIWCKSVKHANPVKFIVEDGDLDRGIFYNKARLLGLPNPIPASKGEYLALEAADWIAYEHLKLITTAHDNVGADVNQRIPFRMMSQLANSWVLYDVSYLEELCQINRIPLRDTEKEVLEKLLPNRHLIIN